MASQLARPALPHLSIEGSDDHEEPHLPPSGTDGDAWEVVPEEEAELAAR